MIASSPITSEKHSEKLQSLALEKRALNFPHHKEQERRKRVPLPQSLRCLEKPRIAISQNRKGSQRDVIHKTEREA